MVRSNLKERRGQPIGQECSCQAKTNLTMPTLSECESTLFSYMRKFTGQLELNADY